MCTVNINNVGVDRPRDQLCLFGKLEWSHEDYSLVKVSFDSFPCNLVADTLNLLERLPFEKNDLIELPGLYIRHEGLADKEEFNKILRQLFAIALASVPEAFIEIDVTIKEEWEEA